jgi:hypothetical protein
MASPKGAQQTERCGAPDTVGGIRLSSHLRAVPSATPDFCRDDFEDDVNLSLSKCLRTSRRCPNMGRVSPVLLGSSLSPEASGAPQWWHPPSASHAHRVLSLSPVPSPTVLTGVAICVSPFVGSGAAQAALDKGQEAGAPGGERQSGQRLPGGLSLWRGRSLPRPGACLASIRCPSQKPATSAPGTGWSSRGLGK